MPRLADHQQWQRQQRQQRQQQLQEELRELQEQQRQEELQQRHENKMQEQQMQKQEQLIQQQEMQQQQVQLQQQMIQQQLQQLQLQQVQQVQQVQQRRQQQQEQQRQISPASPLTSPAAEVGGWRRTRPARALPQPPQAEEEAPPPLPPRRRLKAVGHAVLLANRSARQMATPQQLNCVLPSGPPPGPPPANVSPGAAPAAVAGGATAVQQVQQGSSAAIPAAAGESQAPSSVALQPAPQLPPRFRAAVKAVQASNRLRALPPQPAKAPRAGAPGALSEVTAIADYDATQPDEISFKAGALIKVQKKDGDWWTGSLASDPSVAGVFPSNFVEAAGPAAGSAGTPASGLAVIAVADYTSAEGAQEADLTFKAGAQITLTASEGGWWRGYISKDGPSSKVGDFPSNFVMSDSTKVAPAAPADTEALAPPALAPPAPAPSAPAPPAPAPPAPAADASAAADGDAAVLSEVTAVADYAATQPDEISFKAGASIKVLKKDGDWWTGSLASDPSVAGVFPSNFVEAAGPAAPDGSTAESALGAFEGEVLAAHNEFRAGHGPQCGALAWSDALAAEAKASAEMLAAAGLAVGQPSAAGQPDGENVVVLPGDPSLAGLLTQGGQGGRPAPLASRLHTIPTHFPLNLHTI
jgi:hypothetical protein